MIYLLGGAARSGKSIIAKRMLAEKNIPFLCLDHLAIGAADAFPHLQIDLDSDDASVGAKIWPLVKAVSKVIIKDRIDYLLEGAALQPKHAQELLSEFPSQARACFLGYADADVRRKFEQVREHGGGPDDWMMQFDESTIMKELERLKQVSEVLRWECEMYRIRYFEMSQDFAGSTKAVIEFLAGQNNHAIA